MSNKPTWKTFIQWKGTDVCMDMYCPNCNHHNHYDGYFGYFIKCVNCNTVYECGTEITLTKISEPNASRLVQIQEDTEK